MAFILWILKKISTKNFQRGGSIGCVNMLMTAKDGIMTHMLSSAGGIRVGKRDTAHIFDLIFKQLMMDLSDRAIVQFINGLFNVDHPLDSVVTRLNTESVSGKLRPLRSDMILSINGLSYHIEDEIHENDRMVLRVFEYGFAEAVRTKTVSDDGRKITLKFPSTRIIYWEAAKDAPDEVILSQEYPDGGHYNYKVKVFNFLEHGIEELERQKLAILLPFYVLKLRRSTVWARTSNRRAELATEMKSIVDGIVTVVERCAKAGVMSESDKRTVLEHTERLYKELFKQYSEFKEADTVLQERILTYSEEAELKGRQEGRQEGKLEVASNLLANGVSPDIIVKSTGLSPDQIKNLMN
jgi:predicted transposase/invertase (TIGR01784 family)